ncbi:hypothetical protein [Paracraurococcus lichenis]|uniref:Uncharacterized protein n=1 Tax=Paracraurococcus lichenis TaxID=3064888 RepID=A0ABT9ED75_9PROT|nr:hypothetical protein [Paracraurococcus sp. LOR1-02]MDO9714178.1 hypothetical protein [Paracraurococcus sp. LOR1-02]
MARIARDEYPKIQHLVDVEAKKVAEVAASYGCTPANIYAILSKMRRSADEASTQADPKAPAAPVAADAGAPAEPLPGAITSADPAPPADLFADLPGQAAPRQTDPVEAEGVPARSEQATFSGPAPAAEAPSPEPGAQGQVVAPPTPAPANGPPSRASKAISAASRAMRDATRGGKGAGIALLMRTSDGEETAHPFRSLEELLSASKPILRSASRSAEPIWFSIQQVDLDAFAAEEF